MPCRQSEWVEPSFWAVSDPIKTGQSRFGRLHRFSEEASMSRPDARALLQVEPAASEEEIHAAYRRCVDQVRKRYEKAHDNKTRTQLEREFRALEEARDRLLAEPTGYASEPGGNREDKGAEGQLSTQDAQPPVADLELSAEGAILPLTESPEIELMDTKVNLPGAERRDKAIEVPEPEDTYVPPEVRIPRDEERTVTANAPVAQPPVLWRNPWIIGFAGILTLLTLISFSLCHGPPPGTTGKVVVNTIPSNANVFLDGVSRGKSPLVLEAITSGEHRLKIESAGYESVELIVPVKQAKEVTLPPVRLIKKSSPIPKPTPKGSSPNSGASPGERYPQTRERLVTESDVANFDFTQLNYAIDEMEANFFPA
jgi:PEGA domain